MKNLREVANRIHKIYCGCREENGCGMPQQIEQALISVRAEAIEQAAKVAEECNSLYHDDDCPLPDKISGAIRALIDPKAGV